MLTLIGPLTVAPVEIDSIGSFVVASACLRLIRATLDHLCLIKEKCCVVSRIRATTVVSSFKNLECNGMMFFVTIAYH